MHAVTAVEAIRAPFEWGNQTRCGRLPRGYHPRDRNRISSPPGPLGFSQASGTTGRRLRAARHKSAWRLGRSPANQPVEARFGTGSVSLHSAAEGGSNGFRIPGRSVRARENGLDACRHRRVACAERHRPSVTASASLLRRRHIRRHPRCRPALVRFMQRPLQVMLQMGFAIQSACDGHENAVQSDFSPTRGASRNGRIPGCCRAGGFSPSPRSIELAVRPPAGCGRKRSARSGPRGQRLQMLRSTACIGGPPRHAGAGPTDAASAWRKRPTCAAVSPGGAWAGAHSIIDAIQPTSSAYSARRRSWDARFFVHTSV